MINSRGQSSVEFAVTLTVLILLVVGLLSGVYVGFVQIWIKHASYEAAICLARGELQTKCREELEARVNETLLGEPLENVQLRKLKRSAQVSFEVELIENLKVRERRTLSLPLRETRADYVTYRK